MLGYIPRCCLKLGMVMELKLLMVKLNCLRMTQALMFFIGSEETESMAEAPG